jgi:hypothetical protein
MSARSLATGRSPTAIFGARTSTVQAVRDIFDRVDALVRRRSGPPAMPLPPPRRLDVSIDEEPEPTMRAARLALPPARAVAVTLDDAVAHDWAVHPAR